MKRRALVSQTRIPTRDRDSGSQDVDNMIDALLEDGWSVTFLARDTEPDLPAAERLRRRGVAVHVGFVHAEELIRHGSFDLAVICFWEPASRLVPMFRNYSPSTRLIVNSMDLHFLREARRSFGLGRVLSDGQGGAIVGELNTYHQADLVLAVSAFERDLLAGFLGDGAVDVLPLGEDDEGAGPPVVDRCGLVFVGNFRHLPNGEAVEYLCRDVLPLVDPDVLSAHPLRIVGNHLDRRYSDLAVGLPSVEIVGWVPSVVPYVRRSRAAVVPLLHGAGVKRKVVQSMMMGTPVVTTSVGAEGIEVVNDEQLLIEDDAERLAAAIERVCLDDAVWSRLSTAGRAHVVERNSVEFVKRRFLDLVRGVMERSADRNPDRFRHARAREQGYEGTVSAVRTVIERLADEDGVVLVVSNGDDDLVEIEGRRVEHFPQDAATGGWAGYHPTDSDAAVNHLETLRERGARYLVVPEPSRWWLHFYEGFRRHLDATGSRVVSGRTCVVFDLDGTTLGEVSDAAVVLLGVDDEGALATRLRVAGWSVTSRRGSIRDLTNDDADADASWTVFVEAAALLRPTTIRSLIDLATSLGTDRAQPTHTAGPTAGPPDTERLCGTIARLENSVAPIPMLAVRRGAHVLGPTALVDAVTIGLAGGLTDTDERKGVIAREVWVDGPNGAEPALTDRRGVLVPEISVLVATHDRHDMLRQCLVGLVEQTVASSRYEVIVVDDGSEDDGATRRTLVDFEHRLPIAHVSIDHAGRSSAKNLAVLVARAEIVFFLDDDDVPAPDLLERHLVHHATYNDAGTAVLGRTTWSPELDVSPLMHWLTDHEKILFAYGNLRDGQELDWRGFWEGRVSCRRSFLMRYGLHDQRLHYSIDVEMAHRLAPHGLRVHYYADALSLMVRPIDLAESLRRAEAKATAQATIARLRPGADDLVAYTRIEDHRRHHAEVGHAADSIIATAHRLVEDVGDRFDPDDPRLPELYDALRAAHRSAAARGSVAGAQGADTEIAKGRSMAVPTPTVSIPLPELDADLSEADPSDEAPSITVVVPIWSRTPELADMARRTVERVWDVSRLPTELIVIDNGSPYTTPMQARVHRHAENRGVASAWNAGVDLAHADAVAILNSDCLVEPGWDRALLEAVEDGRRIAFPYTDHADGRGFRSPDQGGTAGWCFMLSRDVLDEVGPFDERFNPAYGEDTDYWHRAWQLGVDLSPVPAARVIHARRSTARTDPYVDWLLTGHRYKYGWKHGVEPLSAPPYYRREIVEYDANSTRGAT